jgi:hypothetical protein
VRERYPTATPAHFDLKGKTDATGAHVLLVKERSAP